MSCLHPDNTDELALTAEKTGAEVLRGSLRYPSDIGGWQPGGREGRHAKLSQSLDHQDDVS